jgi:ABC-type uncharacterized transport system substrate-binding protein
MTTKAIGVLLVGLAFASVHLADAQQQKIPRIGYLAGSGDPNNPGPEVVAFRQGLRDLGYIEGKNILVEYRYRYAEGKQDRIASLVAELVQLKVDVLISPLGPAIIAAKQATKTIPIVMVYAQDPVATGLIDSLAHPGGNITGVTTLTRDLSGKRLELLKEAVPKISRVGILWSTTNLAELGDPSSFQSYEVAASTLKMPLQSLRVREPNPDFEGAFQAAAKGRVRALITVRTTLLIGYRKQIADLAIKNRLPSMSEGSNFVEAGGLMSYSANFAEAYRRAAYYVDKILKASLPICRSSSRRSLSL